MANLPFYYSIFIFISILTCSNTFDIFYLDNITQSRIKVFSTLENKINESFTYSKSSCCVIPTNLFIENSDIDITKFLIQTTSHDNFSKDSINISIYPNSNISNYYLTKKFSNLSYELELQVFNICNTNIKTNYKIIDYLIEVNYIVNRHKYSFYYIKQCKNNMTVKMSNIMKIVSYTSLSLLCFIIVSLSVKYSTSVNSLNISEENKQKLSKRLSLSLKNCILFILFINIFILLVNLFLWAKNIFYCISYIISFFSLFFLYSIIIKNIIRQKSFPGTLRECLKIEILNMKLYKYLSIIFSIITLVLWHFRNNLLLINWISFGVIISSVSFIFSNTFINLLILNILLIAHDSIWYILEYYYNINYNITTLEQFFEPIKIVIPNFNITSCSHPCTFVSVIDLIMICLLIKYSQNFDLLKDYSQPLYFKYSFISFYIGSIFSIIFNIFFNSERLLLMITQIFMILVLIFLSLCKNEFNDFMQGNNMSGMKKAVNYIIDSADMADDFEKKQLKGNLY